MSTPDKASQAQASRQPLKYYYHCIELADDFYLPQSIRDWAQQEALRMKTEYKLA